MKNRAESIHKVWTVNICYGVHFGGRFGTNVKSPDMGLEKCTQGALGGNHVVCKGYKVANYSKINSGMASFILFIDLLK